MSEDNTKINPEDVTLKDEYDFSRGVRGRFYRPKKKASEKKVGYQTLVNAALREFVKHHGLE